MKSEMEKGEKYLHVWSEKKTFLSRQYQKENGVTVKKTKNAFSKFSFM